MQLVQPWVHLGRVVAALLTSLMQFLRASVRPRIALADDQLLKDIGFESDQQ